MKVQALQMQTSTPLLQRFAPQRKCVCGKYDFGHNECESRAAEVDVLKRQAASRCSGGETPATVFEVLRSMTVAAGGNAASAQATIIRDDR